MPASFIKDPGHWRQRAEQMRALAMEMVDPETRQTMLQLALDYERLAVRAIQRSDESSMPDSRRSE
jgi:hypothetical protein